MITLSEMSLKTQYMMEQMRLQAIEDTFNKYREALKNYYTQGYDNGESVKYYKELEELGVEFEVLFETDMEIRDSVYNENGGVAC